MTDWARIRNLGLRVLFLAVLVVCPLYLFGYIPVLDTRFQPSLSPAYMPVEGDSFSDYIAQNQQRIRDALTTHFYSKNPQPFGADYPLEKVVQMRSPFEITPDPATCESTPGAPRQGFLLIHGLTDSPYLLSELASSLSGQYPCAVIRSLLVPGHGTVPGDLLTVDLGDWRQVVSFGVDSFRDDVDALYLVGYSNGSPLAIDYWQEHPENPRIAGFILLSPGLAAAQSSISMAPWLKYFVRWVSRGTDTDAAKYDSMPTNAAALFYQITEKVSSPGQPPVDRPVFMAMSGDDTTVDTGFAASYFCSRVVTEQRRLIWYRSLATGTSPPVQCNGMEIVDVSVPEARFVSHSHVSISMPTSNRHYGLDGDYVVCSAYRDDAQAFKACSEEDASTLYGENTLRDETRRYQGKLVRRATFNPLYDQMLAELTCFIDQNCDSQVR